jgi:retrotransposon gag protein
MLLNSPLSAEILATPNPAKIKIPAMNSFDGTTCPEEHVVAYKNLMLLYTTSQALLCKFFPITLICIALNWYTSQPAGSIRTFAQLEAKFVNHFVASKRQEKSNFHLLSIVQQEGESVATYLKKFQEAVLEVTDLEDSVALNALINGMRTPKLKFQLVEHQVKSYAEAMRQCQSYVTASEICQAHNTKKRKHDKGAASNHPQKAHREDH